MRASLAALLLLCAGLLSFPAAAAAWEQRVLMNQDSFVTAGNDVLRREPVQQELATHLTNEITGLTGRSLLIDAGQLAVRPFVLPVVRDLPDSPTANQALITTHELLVLTVREDTIQPEGDTIVLDLNQAVVQVAERLSLGQDLTNRIPPETGRLTLVTTSELAPAFRLARWFDGAALYVAIAPFAVLALAFLIAPNRRRFLAYAGLTIVVFAVLRIVLLKGPVESWITDRAIQDESARAAVSAAYEVLSDSFVQQDVILLAAGVAVAVVGIVLSIVIPSEA